MNGRQNEKKRKNIFFKETISMWFSPGTGMKTLKRPKDLVLPFLELTLRRCTEIKQLLGTLALRSGCSQSS